MIIGLAVAAASCSSGADVSKTASSTKATTTTKPSAATTTPSGIDPTLVKFCQAVAASSNTSTAKLADPAATIADKEVEVTALLHAYDAIPPEAPASIRADVQSIVDYEHKLIDILRPVNFDNTKLDATSASGKELKALQAALSPTNKKVNGFITAGCTPPAAATTSSGPTTSAASTTVVQAKAVFGDSPCPPPSGTDKPVITFTSPPTLCIVNTAKYTATFDTTEGTIVVELDTKRAPVGTNNFVFLARNHYYDNTEIFRTDPGLDIIQGGSPHTQSNTDPGPGYTFADDTLGFKYAAGDLVFANSGRPNTSGGQIFFAAGPNVSKLDSQGTYITFGHTTQGIDVLKKIIALNSGSGTLGGKPSHSVTVKTVTVVETPA